MMSESSCVQDPWEKWVLNKALQVQRNQIKKAEEIRGGKQQEMLRLEKDRMKDQKNREVYARWLSEKNRVHYTEVAERQRLENDGNIEREHRDKVLEQKASENYRSWKRVKKEEAGKRAQVRLQDEEERLESRKSSRLRAAEAYEQWLINHPFQILPQSSFVNPKSWVDDDAQD